MKSSRDIPMMEIVIPFFAVKKKKRQKYFPLSSSSREQ